MRVLLGILAGATLGVTATVLTRRHVPVLLWTILSRGDR